MPSGGYTKTTWVNGTTAVSQANMNNLETSYDQATRSYEKNFLTPFVLVGGVGTIHGGLPKQMDVTDCTYYPLQTDGTLYRQFVAATNFTTVTPSTTYFLDYNPDGTTSWATTHSGVANFMPIASVTTDVSGNISVITDARVVNTTILASAVGQVSVVSSSANQVTSTNANSNTPQVKASANAGLSTQDATYNSTRYVGLMPTESDGNARGTAFGYVDGAGAFHALAGTDSSAALRYLGAGPTGAIYRTASYFSGGGSGTFNHGYPATPSYVGVMDNTSGSQTMSVSSIGSSTCVVNAFAGHSWLGVAMG